MKKTVFAFSLIVVVLLGIATVAKDKDSSHPAVSTVQEFTNAYNEKNIDKLVSLYATDAVMVSEAGVAEGSRCHPGPSSMGGFSAATPLRR